MNSPLSLLIICRPSSDRKSTDIITLLFLLEEVCCTLNREGMLVLGVLNCQKVFRVNPTLFIWLTPLPWVVSYYLVVEGENVQIG